MAEFTEFEPVKIVCKTGDKYDGTTVPKLTRAQVEFARTEFAGFLARIAALGMKFDYDHMNGGFYVRDFRLCWPSFATDRTDADEQTIRKYDDIISDGNIDIGSDPNCSQALPLFSTSHEGFRLIEGMGPSETMPY